MGTVQILGAEKALFRALKTKGNTPKYGLIFHSTFIGRAQQKNKGRISRYLANKCSIASRIDCFSEEATTVFGEKLRDQVEERLNFLTEGTKPRKNIEVMQEAMKEVKKRKKKKAKAAPEGADAGAGEKKKKKKKVEEAEEAVEEEVPKKKKEEKSGRRGRGRGGSACQKEKKEESGGVVCNGGVRSSAADDANTHAKFFFSPKRLNA